MPQCAEAFEEMWQLEQHCFDCHGQTRAQLMATSLNHGPEIQEQRERPTCKTDTFWQRAKDLLQRVRGVVEGFWEEDVTEAQFRAELRELTEAAVPQARNLYVEHELLSTYHSQLKAQAQATGRCLLLILTAWLGSRLSPTAC